MANPEPKRDWIEWNTQTSTLGDEVINALAAAAAAAEQHPWASVFAALLDACEQRRADPTGHWPRDLGGPPLIDKLLTDHRL